MSNEDYEIVGEINSRLPMTSETAATQAEATRVMRRFQEAGATRIWVNDELVIDSRSERVKKADRA